MRQKLIIVSFVLLAFCLPIVMFEEDVRTINCTSDVCDLGWNNGLLWPYMKNGHYYQIAESGKFVPQAQVPLNASLREAWKGIYSRWDISPIPVILLGVILPLIFLIAAISIFVRAVNGPKT